MLAPKMCVPRILTKEQEVDAINFALRENPLNRRVGADPSHLALEVDRKWANGRTLHVRFLNGNATQHAKTIQKAKIWESYANIHFLFDDSPTAEIRVAFNDGKKFTDPGSWSYLGTDCFIAGPDEQTVNFGWLTSITPDHEWERVVVHEFGHVLGCVHEDQQPAENIQWNKPVVYKWFMGPPNNWSKDDVDQQVLDPTPKDGMDYTDFDPVSIMAYSIPPQFTLDGKGVKGGETLSELDKKKIAQIYPKLTVITPGLHLEVADGTDQFEFAPTKTGEYRIWTSLAKHEISVFDGLTLIAKGTQQVECKLDAKIYTIVLDTQNTKKYRISTRCLD